jgi:hypothetical protein
LVWTKSDVVQDSALDRSEPRGEGFERGWIGLENIHAPCTAELQKCGEPLAKISANIYHAGQVTTAEEIREQLDSRLDEGETLAR